MTIDETPQSPAAGSPRARRDLLLQEVGEEGLLYDREAAQVHVLNRTALLIWKLCDGGHGPEAITIKLVEAFTGAEASRVRGDVDRVLADFSTRGLLEPDLQG